MTIISQDDHLTTGAWAACDRDVLIQNLLTHLNIKITLRLKLAFVYPSGALWKKLFHSLACAGDSIFNTVF